MEFVDPDSIRESCESCDGSGDIESMEGKQISTCQDCEGTGEQRE